MPVNKENKKEYDLEYRRKHIVRKLIPFNVDKPEDKELWNWLETQGNITAYIKALIRQDMGKTKDA